MDVISISDSTDGSVGIHSPLLRYSAAKSPAQQKEGSPLTEEPVSLSSESTERCPVTWRSKQKKKIELLENAISEKTPCATTKVESWLMQQNQRSNINALQLEALDGSTILRLEPLTQGGSILIRHDYNKDVISYANAKPYYISRNIFSPKKVVDGEVICLDSEDSDSRNPVDDKDDADKVLLKKPKQKVADVPLSPESQKKSELCSYLQLMDMNCADKKIGSVMQNRRSVRVQNLNMLFERKKLERKLLTETKESEENPADGLPENDKDLAKKSFAELKMNVLKEGHEDAASKPKASEDVHNCCAPKANFLSVAALPKKILRRHIDFDKTMREFIDAEKIAVPKSNVQLRLRKFGSLPGKKTEVSPSRILKKRGNLRSTRQLKLVGGKRNNSSKKPGANKKRRKLLRSAKKKLRRKSSPPKETKPENVLEATVVNEEVKESEAPQEKECTPSPEKKQVEEGRKSKENGSAVRAFREKSFCVIDLSHQHDYAGSGTLLDHNYASKPQLDKNYVMNVIVGDADEKRREIFSVSVPEPTPPTKLKANGQQELAKKRKLTVASLYADFSDELNSKVFGGDKINLTVNEKPPVNIFDDSEYLKSPVSLSDTCVKEILGSLKSNEETSPIIGRKRAHYIPFNSKLEVKPLHKSLTRSKRKLWSQSVDPTWDDKNGGDAKRHDEKKSYSIQISKRDGRILNAFYLDFNLIIAQEQAISFWSQSALGNMLGAQNMWISKGSVQRLVTDVNCVFKKSPQTVISLENSVAYVELWIKEHKSDKRERPVADIFATIYFCRHRLNGPDKKVLQLENINGVASDVQYVVLRNSRNIIVSWCETCDDSRRTYIHCYNLASDYQTVVSIREMGNVNHYISSLHNIEDCDTLVMGCGEHKASLWNVEYSYVVATVAIDDIRSEPSTLWVKCDRGFLFLLQFYELEKLFKLIAINGIHHSWKRLKMFTFPSGYKGLRGVCLDNNILGAFYDNGVVCWNIQTGESVIEEMCSENVYIPSEKHIIILSQSGILVRHALSHFITSYDL